MMRYHTYKPSGIEWLGEIPEHWEVKRVKDVFKGFGSGTTPNTSVEYYYDDGEISWLNTTDLNNNIVVDTKQKITRRALQECGLKVYPENSLAIAMYGQGKTRGTVGLLKMPFTTNQASCIMYKSFKTDTKYILYWFIHKYEDIRGLNTGATQPNMNLDFVKFLPLQFPTSIEQTAIANYLDTKTTAIDRKIELLTAKTDKYKALRRSLINETVCRGLNPNAPIKDSGIEWIGKIPEHWEKYRMKDLGFLYSGLSGKSGDDFNQDENENNCDFIPFTNIFNNDTINLNIMGKVVIYQNEKQNNVKKNDLFFLMSSEDYDGLGKSSLLTIDLKKTYLNSFCKGFRITKKQVFPTFLNYQLQSHSFRKVMQIEGKGFTRLNLKSEKITDFNVFIPSSIEEQILIVDYLDEKTTQIDTILTNLSEQINKLTRLRKILINDVVTGKIKVTEDFLQV